MSEQTERISGSYDDTLYKSTYTLLYFPRDGQMTPLFVTELQIANCN